MLADESGELKPEQVKFAAASTRPTSVSPRRSSSPSWSKKNGILLIDAATDAGLGAAESIRIQGITSCMAAPLFVEDKVIGLIYLEVRLGRKSFTEEDLRLLTSLANTAAIKIQNLRLREGAAATAAHRARDGARVGHPAAACCPEAEPDRFRTRRSSAGRSRRGPSRATTTTSTSAATGRSTSSSRTSAARAWARRSSPRRSRPRSRCGRARTSRPTGSAPRLNDLVYRRTSPEKFVTFILALYDPESGGVVYTNAGHNSGHPRRARTGRVEMLGAHGPPLGLFPGEDVRLRQPSRCGPGDLLALYTDGVTEAANPDDEEFGDGPARRDAHGAPAEAASRSSRSSSPRRSSTFTGGNALRRRPDARAPQARLAGSGSGCRFASRGSIPCRLSISFSVVGLRPRSSAARFWTPFARPSAAERSARSYAPTASLKFESPRPGTRRGAGPSGARRRELVEVDDAVPEDERPLEDVLELADVPRPVVVEERLHRGGRHGREGAAVLRGGARDEASRRGGGRRPSARGAAAG